MATGIIKMEAISLSLLQENLNSYFTSFLELVFPSHCVVCHRLTSSFVCPECLPKLPWIKEHCLYCGLPTPISLPNCRDCRHKKTFFDQAKSVFSYEAEVKDVIYNFKYYDQKWLAAPLAFYLAGLCQKFPFHPEEVITWVPMTNLKKLSRGYNQAQLLAVNLAKVRKSSAIGLLIKPQSTAEQNSLSLKERKKNLKGAFKLAPKVTKLPSQVILVDDVYTTGATASECSAVLKKAGVEKVFVVTVARTV